MVFAYCTNRPFVHKIVHKQEGIYLPLLHAAAKSDCPLNGSDANWTAKKTPTIMYLIAGKNNTSCYISLCIIDTCLLTILSINMTSLERVSTIRGNEKESVREYNFSQNTDGRDAATLPVVWMWRVQKNRANIVYYNKKKETTQT